MKNYLVLSDPKNKFVNILSPIAHTSAWVVPPYHVHRFICPGIVLRIIDRRNVYLRWGEKKNGKRKEKGNFIWENKVKSGNGVSYN